MANITREQKLLNILRAEELSEPNEIDWFLHHRNRVRLGTILCSLSGYARTRAVYAYFIEKSIEKCKQNFYLASKLKLASVGQDGGAEFEVGVDILAALLSDSREVIEAIASVETPALVKERSNPLNNRFHVYMLQLAIRGEDEALRSMVEKIAKHGRKPLREECAEEKDFYSLLLKRDKVALEKLIQEKHAPIKSHDPIDEDFMSYFGTLEAKLCWYRGIPVEIDHPLVPMELMPIRPLAAYDDVYDFLKPGWVPPPQGLMGKLSRWIGKRT
ncbi:contact-dependent inhibition immunity protein BcpI [Ralstonia pseudosolanacearum]|uniref:contact-dependent inhibition immunity protein BcpI n=1 Tax=Ralstonia pseudosolanacearum TaxID=1310165 RepID=UPI0009E45954|nr:contact-dependent inhibition immunity protein BcpI [Ralstonia pseudosolanacearum]